MHDRHGQQQEQGVRRPGPRQLRHEFSRCDRRSRDDRPISDQRHRRCTYEAFRLFCRCIPVILDLSFWAIEPIKSSWRRWSAVMITVSISTGRPSPICDSPDCDFDGCDARRRAENPMNRGGDTVLQCPANGSCAKTFSSEISHNPPTCCDVLNRSHTEYLAQQQHYPKIPDVFGAAPHDSRMTNSVGTMRRLHAGELFPRSRSSAKRAAVRPTSL